MCITCGYRVISVMFYDAIPCTIIVHNQKSATYTIPSTYTVDALTIKTRIEAGYTIGVNPMLHCTMYHPYIVQCKASLCWCTMR
jgi:hypothetical protein